VLFSESVTSRRWVRETEEIATLLHITYPTLTTTSGSQDIPTSGLGQYGSDQSEAGPHRGAVLTSVPPPHPRASDEDNFGLWKDNLTAIMVNGERIHRSSRTSTPLISGLPRLTPAAQRRSRIGARRSCLIWVIRRRP
jgi:hypothetical protein